MPQTDAERFRQFRRRKLRRRILIGVPLLLIWLEVVLRMLFVVSPGTMPELGSVRMIPLIGAQMGGRTLWISDDPEFLTLTNPDMRGLQVSFGGGDGSMVVDTYNWGGRLGFRSPRPVGDTPFGVALGDSFTFCFVEMADCWVTKVAEGIGLPLATMGMSASGPTSHLRAYRQYVHEAGLKPRLVIWQFFGNDFNEDFGLAALSGTNVAPPASPVPSAFALWLSENSALYTAMRTVADAPARSALYKPAAHIETDSFDLHVGQPYTLQAADMRAPQNLEGEALAHAAILALRDLAAQDGAVFVVVVMPFKETVYADLIAPELAQAALDHLDAPRLRMLDFCEAQGLVCFDALPALRVSSAQTYYPRDMHLNPAGNRTLGEALIAYLREQRLLR